MYPYLCFIINILEYWNIYIKTHKYMAFITKLDFSNNRQVKQLEQTITNLSGGTSFGLTFSALTTGPDLNDISIISTSVNLTSSFSGNSGTTNYSWADIDMSLGEPSLLPINSSTSATTQDASGYVSATTIVVDGNVIVTSYTGVSYDVSVLTLIELGGGDYSGTVFTNILEKENTGSLSFTGRTIWVDVSGYTRTENLIMTGLPVYADNTAAASLEVGRVYRTSTGDLKIKY
jgi:hypothetical protein